MYLFLSTDLEPKVPLPDCASRFLRLAFFLELSSPEDLRTYFTVKRYVPLSLEKKKLFSFWQVFTPLCWFLQISRSVKVKATYRQVNNLTSSQPIKLWVVKLLARDNSDVCALISGLWLAEILKANKKRWKLSSEKVRCVSQCYLTFLTFCQLFHLQLN